VLIMASVAENLAAAEARIKADALVSARSEAVATASDSRSIDLLVTVGDRVEQHLLMQIALHRDAP